MAGKAKDVSFHQFPRNEELARLWNKILKRGKPYTKYSKVCSLHFRPEDYTLNKTKGQWRTLRKDAIPSQNLPTFESPGPSRVKTTNGCWLPAQLPSNLADPQIQQQVAQAIYMQTMLAMQAATNGTPLLEPKAEISDSPAVEPHNLVTLEKAILLQKNSQESQASPTQEDQNYEQQRLKNKENNSYRCEECMKCFKDPDVFVLHTRTHRNTSNANKETNNLLTTEKENFNTSKRFSNEDTLKANPILANLLKSGMASHNVPVNGLNVLDVNNILSIENQIMAALAANMEGYIRLLYADPNENKDCISSDNDNLQNEHDLDDENSSDSGQLVKNEPDHEEHSSKSDFVDENGGNLEENRLQIHLSKYNNSQTTSDKYQTTIDNCQTTSDNCQITSDNSQNKDDDMMQGSQDVKEEPGCDNEDLNEIKDSLNIIKDSNSVVTD